MTSIETKNVVFAANVKSGHAALFAVQSKFDRTRVGTFLPKGKFRYEYEIRATYVARFSSVENAIGQMFPLCAKPSPHFPVQAINLTAPAVYGMLAKEAVTRLNNTRSIRETSETQQEQPALQLYVRGSISDKLLSEQPEHPVSLAYKWAKSAWTSAMIAKKDEDKPILLTPEVQDKWDAMVNAAQQAADDAAERGHDYGFSDPTDRDDCTLAEAQAAAQAWEAQGGE